MNQTPQGSDARRRFFVRAGLGKPKSHVLNLRPRNANHGICREVRSVQQVAGRQPAMVERVLSSVGRAAPLQGVGRGFEPLSTHHRSTSKNQGLRAIWVFFFCLFHHPASEPQRASATQSELLDEITADIGASASRCRALQEWPAPARQP
ncbi:protein of unknown function [Cupriavidus taiwanensis]|uniref:Uncharacterized protein n=1 Tax=Cupriavidus taiwanensis TaxID=164546 RepID=A0A9Q7UT82_9BURK|nr:protein of unknown function [Cupriavidus taiwanensis]